MTRSQNMVIKNNLNSLNSILVRSYSSSGLGSGVKITYNTVVVWYRPWDSSSCWVSCLVMGRWRGRAILMKLCSSNWWTDQRLLSSFIRHLNNNNRAETPLVSVTAKSCRSTRHYKALLIESEFGNLNSLCDKRNKQIANLFRKSWKDDGKWVGISRFDSSISSPIASDSKTKPCVPYGL